MRALVALGGNALTGPDGSFAPEDQEAAVAVAAESVAELVATGTDVVLTHGNGPQVGDLLLKNETAAAISVPTPLVWCGAQTQGSIGFLLLDALDAALSAHSRRRPVAALVTRTLVAADDPGFAAPSKPIGRYLPKEQADLLVAHGQRFVDRGDRGWRRVVASPEPLEILDAAAAAALLVAGFVVVAAGGGGIPVVRDVDGTLSGVQAVIDKDLAAALLARTLGADVLVLATDVDHVLLGYGTPRARPIEGISTARLRGIQRDDGFESGSMGPKVEAALRFVEAGGTRAVITSLDHIAAAAAGDFGTVVTR